MSMKYESKKMKMIKIIAEKSRISDLIENFYLLNLHNCEFLHQLKKLMTEEKLRLTTSAFIVHTNILVGDEIFECNSKEKFSHRMKSLFLPPQFPIATGIFCFILRLRNRVAITIKGKFVLEKFWGKKNENR